MDKPRRLDGELTRRIIKVMSAVNVRAYRATGGRVGGTWRVGAAWRKPAPICLLEHVGRRTGRVRTTPLVCLEDGERVVVVASPAGRPRHPRGFRTLEAEPDAVVQVGRERRPMRARTADPVERAALWPRLLEVYADFESYQSWTDRGIPVVVLEPR